MLENHFHFTIHSEILEGCDFHPAVSDTNIISNRIATGASILLTITPYLSNQQRGSSSPRHVVSLSDLVL